MACKQLKKSNLFFSSLTANPSKPVQCCLLKLYVTRLKCKTDIFPVLEMYLTRKETKLHILNLVIFYQIMFILHHARIFVETLRHYIADSRCFGNFELPELAMSTKRRTSFLLFVHFVSWMRQSYGRVPFHRLYIYRAKLRLLSHLWTWDFLSFLNLWHSNLNCILIFYLMS